MKCFLSICGLFLVLFEARAQTYTGTVTDESGAPLEMATVKWINTDISVLTDSSGYFSLEKPVEIPATAIISYVGYLSDTVSFPGTEKNRVRLNLRELENTIVEGHQSSSLISTNNVNKVELLNIGELHKAACCNLSESFETNATIDVHFADAVTGSKTIQMLGLDGKYVQITTELIPSIRGLATPYGLSYISGTWMESIQIAKGIGSVVNGYEGLTGQINVEMKKPEEGERLLVNLYGNHMGRAEGNIFLRQKIGKRWSTAVLLHGDYFNTKRDHNHDHFIDMPLIKQGSFVNRWKYIGRRTEAVFGVKGLYEQRNGGNLAYFHQDTVTQPYGVDLKTYRGEAFLKYGILFPGMDWKSIGIIMNGTFHRQEGYYGSNNYFGEQKTGYLNLIYQSIISNTKHQFKTGASMLVDDIHENFANINIRRLELVPGGFFEYTYQYLKSLTLVAGFRLDYHNKFGWFPQPRLHVRYEPVKGLVLRASGGRGFRVPMVFAENTGLLMTSRNITIESGIKPEDAWNYGASATYSFYIFKRDAQVSADFFRTDFVSQLIADREAQGDLRFYYINAGSFSNVVQLNFQFEPLSFWSLRFGYKYQDVRARYDNQLEAVPLVPNHKGLFNTAFNFRKIGLEIDFTVNVTGPSRYPEVLDPETGQLRPLVTPWFAILNAQVTKKFKWMDIYIGGENLTGYKQQSPIIAPHNPESAQFDASLVYAPIFGQMFYLGLRFKVDYKP